LTIYTFNGYDVGPGAIPRIIGKKLAAISSRANAVLAGEWPAFFGGPGIRLWIEIIRTQKTS